MCTKFVFAILVAAVAAATADDVVSEVVAPFPVVKTTITGESGTITEERHLPVPPVVPYLYGSKVFPYVLPSTVKVLPSIGEVKSVKVKSSDDSEAVEIESAPATLPPHLISYPYFGYYPTYPAYALNGGHYYYRFY